MPRQANYYGLILAGGRGTRFWPRSRRTRAKQVLRFLGDRSLIQQTVDRLSPVIPTDRLWVLTNEHLRAEIVRQLPELPKNQILAEPAQRNTAPAIGLAAHILQSIDPNAVMGVFPSDHMISKPARYLRFVRAAFKAAAEGKIVVLGIQPRWPETGYGYIEFPKGVSAGSLHPRGQWRGYRPVTVLLQRFACSSLQRLPVGREQTQERAPSQERALPSSANGFSWLPPS